MNPILEEIEKVYAGRIVVEKYDVDDEKNQAIVQKYQVMAMPTYFIEKDGQVVEQFIGAQAKSILSAALDKALG